ncbi:MAG: hypothetical protein AAF447_09100 [Myxococcota bacterium]
MSAPPEIGPERASAALTPSPAHEGDATLRAQLADAGFPVLGEGAPGSGPKGMAWSVDPEGGDTEAIVVRGEGAGEAWRIDRRSGRADVNGDGLRRDVAEDAADLADRAQLALGQPVCLRWALSAERPALVSVEALVPSPRFVEGRWRLLTLVAPDEGTVAPLSIDTLDRALGAREPGPAVDATVRRIFARPYRRQTPGAPSLGRGRRLSRGATLRRSARVAPEVAPFITAAHRYEREAPGALARREVVRLEDLSTERLLAEARERQRLVAEALLLLDDGRRASRAALLALEAALGPLGDDDVTALAVPRPPRARRTLDARLESLHRAESASGRPDIEARRELRGALARVRPWGIDLAPGPLGNDDARVARALEDSPRGGAARERAREEAEQRAIARARSRGFGREATVRAILALARRVARAKGGVSDAHARASLAFRDAALTLGRRLVAAAVLERKSDALYLWMEELADALRGEPGAYAARVRLRREDDARWARFEVPRTLGDPRDRDR